MRRIAIDGERPVVGEPYRLDDESAHYVVNVLRCDVGEPLELFDGDGDAWEAELVETDPATVSVHGVVDRSVESPCEVWLYQAIPKSDRFEWALEKATELGVRRIVPIETARSVVRIPKKRVQKKLDRWTRIVTSAARQSGRLVVPEIAAPRTLREAIDADCAGDDDTTHLYLHPGSEERVADVVTDARRVGVWIGPEGGFTDEEVSLLARHAVGVSVGPRVLRSETAGIVAVALVQERTGGLR